MTFGAVWTILEAEKLKGGIFHERKTYPPEQDDAILENVTGGSTDYRSFLFRCPKCGREGRHNVQGLSPKLKCIFCMVNMEIVDGSVQEVIVP